MPRFHGHLLVYSLGYNYLLKELLLGENNWLSAVVLIIYQVQTARVNIALHI